MLKINGENSEVTKATLHETIWKETMVWNDKNPPIVKTGPLKAITLFVDFKTKEKINDKYIDGNFTLDIMNVSFDMIDSLLGKKIEVSYKEYEEDDKDIDYVYDIDNFELSSDSFSYYDGWHHDNLPGDIYLIFVEKKDDNVLIKLHVDDVERKQTLIEFEDYIKIKE